MRFVRFFMLMVLLTGFATGNANEFRGANEIWVSESNFLELPNYNEVDELVFRPDEAECLTLKCDKAVIFGQDYYRAILISEDNYKDYLVGAWAGGDCVDDLWELDISGDFSSRYPADFGVYSWKGRYFLSNGLYVEKGVNNHGEKEWNEAYLYYVPVKEFIIFKGTRSLNHLINDGSLDFIHYEGPEFPYFKRCK